MEQSFFDLIYFLHCPGLAETFLDVLLSSVPIWLAVMIGLVIGWSWRPRWTGLLYLGLRSKLRFAWTAPPGFGARRFWLVFTAFSVGRRLWSRLTWKGKDGSPPPAAAAAAQLGGGDVRPSTGTSQVANVVVEKDLEHLLQLIENNGGKMEWQSMMGRSTSNLTYQAWRHDLETGPTVYRSRTVFEDATPEMVRDFFWDDEFRTKWDTMLAYFKILKECSHTGTMIVQWIKKFPFFCSDREYIIGRRIWEAGNTYYCVTKGVPYPALQRREKPRRVDLYFSSWVIKPVQSRKGDEQLSACEVNLVHYEDMGIPKDVAKLGVRHGMWGTVKKLHSGFRAYQQARKYEAPLSRSALMASIAMKISSEENTNSLEIVSSEEEEEEGQAMDIQRPGSDRGGVDWKWVVMGGTVALVCGLHTGVIGKALLLGAGQRVARK